LFVGVVEEWFWDADVKNNFSRNGPAAMNKNMHEIAFTTSINSPLLARIMSQGGRQDTDTKVIG
jgi:hypothetical protein